MSNSVLSSFDPLATHPFTNNSAVLPKPAAPSQYPHHVPASSKSVHSAAHPHPHAHPHAHAQGPIILATTPAPAHGHGHVHAPQPKRAAAPAKAGSSSGPKPIFVPFRPDRSSPDLEDILLKKKFADAFQGKAQWGIDQVAPPVASGWHGKAQ